MNPIHQLLKKSKTIAVVGLSPKPERTSYAVAQYMQKAGYRIIPINPQAAGQSILGEVCYPSINEAVKHIGCDIDIVNVFRKSEDVPPVLEDTFAAQRIAHIKAFWLQLGITHPDAERMAEKAGLQVIADRCIKVEHYGLR